MTNYIQGEENITVTAPYTVSSGGGVLAGSLFGVAAYDASANDSLEIVTEGVFDLAKTSAQAWAQGDNIYWNDTSKTCNNLGDGLFIGQAILAAANPSSTGRVRLAGHVNPLRMRLWRAKYDFAVDGGAQVAITPKISDQIPAKAVIVGSLLNSPTAITSGGAATVAVGTTAGSSATSIKGATAIASFSADALVAGVPVFSAASAVKMSAAGQINITVATADLTAGVLEIVLFGYLASQ